MDDNELEELLEWSSGINRTSPNSNVWDFSSGEVLTEFELYILFSQKKENPQTQSE